MAYYKPIRAPDIGKSKVPRNLFIPTGINKEMRYVSIFSRNSHPELSRGLFLHKDKIMPQQTKSLTLTPIQYHFDRLNAAYLSKFHIPGPMVAYYQTPLDTKTVSHLTKLLSRG